MRRQLANPPIFGRAAEQAALRELMAAARSGQGGALVVHGEAGVGKTLLLRAADAEASDFEVLRVAGVESEMHLGFAALHRLLAPLLDDSHLLPDAQRHAVERTFGLRDGHSDRFLVSLAALTLITERAVTQPVLCVVDDAQWIDRESLEVINFTALRLQADRVALILALRSGTSATADVPDALPRLAVKSLAPSDARALLATVATDIVSESVAARIVEATGGVPLALIELADELSTEQLSGRATLPEILPVGTRLHRHYREQLERLPDDAQLLLLLAASEPTNDPAVVRRAARSLGLPDEAYDAAERSRLASFVPTIEFRHPLVRSAVYSGADAAGRRRAHNALADATDSHANPDGRAWHLAAAAIGPDEAVAAELWRCADIAYSRGGYAAEAAFRVRAADLTPDASVRGPRLLSAARAHLTGGAPHAVPALLERATPLLSEPADHAEALRLGAMARLGLLPGTVAAALLKAARLLEPIDTARASEVYGEAIHAVMTSLQYSVDTTPREVAQATLDRAGSDEDHDITDLMIDAFATRLAVSYDAAFPLIRRAFEALYAEEAPLVGLVPYVNFLAAEIWDDRGTYELLQRGLHGARQTGALEVLRLGLVPLGHHEMWRGRFDASDECCAEMVELSTAIGGNGSAWALGFVELRAWRGDAATTREMAALLLSPYAEAAGAAAVANCGHLALTLLGLAEGRYRDAFEHAWHVFELDSPAQGNQAIPEVVESAVRCGEIGAGVIACERLSERANIAATPWALGLLARSKALLAADSEAEKLYREAIELLQQTEIACEVARAELLYGEWLRRERRRTDAREHLRTALSSFESMGARGFEARARAELAATGEKARRRTVDTANKLTPQESQVSRLAAAGATNAEIAAQLFISSATVDYHLRKVFRKLGISSRRELKPTSFTDS